MFQMFYSIDPPVHLDHIYKDIIDWLSGASPLKNISAYKGLSLSECLEPRERAIPHDNRSPAGLTHSLHTIVEGFTARLSYNAIMPPDQQHTQCALYIYRRTHTLSHLRLTHEGCNNGRLQADIGDGPRGRGTRCR